MLELPQNIIVNRFVSKEKIYAQADVPSKIRQLFVLQIEKIVWLAKISPSTMNITADADFPEIDVFELKLKTRDFNIKILETIDAVIPRPILFQITYGGQEKYAIAYKEPIAKDKRKILHYYQTEWVCRDGACTVLMQIKGNSVRSIYENFIRQIDPTVETWRAASSAEIAEKSIEINKLRKETEKIKTKITNEPQENKRHELARKRIELNEKIKSLLQ